MFIFISPFEFLQKVNRVEVDHGPQDSCQPNENTGGEDDYPIQGEFGILELEAGCRCHDICPDKPERDHPQQVKAPARTDEDQGNRHETGRASQEYICKSTAVMYLLLVKTIGCPIGVLHGLAFKDQDLPAKNEQAKQAHQCQECVQADLRYGM